MKKNFLAICIVLFFVCCSSKKYKNANYDNTSKVKLKVSHRKPLKTFVLDSYLNEGSGLIGWNGYLWAHNDSGSAVLFAVDTLTGKIAKKYNMPGLRNDDWEDLSQDDNYFYIGAFGNNSQKKDSLKIYRVDKKKLVQNKTVIDSIVFTWPEILSRGKMKKNNFNCEAMAVVDNTIYLFTKEWKNGMRSKVFTIPKNPGTYIANYKTSFKVNILITGANYNAVNRNLVLCGHNVIASPSLIVFPNFEDANTFGKEGLKIKLRQLSFHQVEGIATFDGMNYYLINEDLRFLFLHQKQQINQILIVK
jgi:hypothetical protein